MSVNEVEKLCVNCNNYFPAEQCATEFGICLNDKEFDPYIDDIFENNFAKCSELIKKKRFNGSREVCENYSQVDGIEIDDDSELGKFIKASSSNGEFDKDKFNELLMLEQIKKIDWANLPIDESLQELKSTSRLIRERALSHLGGLIFRGNKNAFDALLNYLKELPVPVTIEEVHYRLKILRQINTLQNKKDLIPVLVYELYKIPSNNTTKQWIGEIFKFLSRCKLEDAQDHLEGMLESKHFSFRLKKKIKDLLNPYTYSEFY